MTDINMKFISYDGIFEFQSQSEVHESQIQITLDNFKKK